MEVTSPPFATEEDLTQALSAALHTRWPLPGQRWNPEAKKTVGVYALVWDCHAYVGMTVSSAGFQGRWAKHHRALFVRKRGDSTTKLMRDFIKAQCLTPQDFNLLALQVWPRPIGEEELRLLADEIALVEQAKYDELQLLGFNMLNNVRPRGTGYSIPVRRKRKRGRRPVAKKTVQYPEGTTSEY